MMQVAQTPAELIRQRRTQMLVHSYLYYWTNDTLVSDHEWQAWANELADLQRAHPAAIGFYDAEFRDWTGDTGMHLPQDDWVREKVQLVRTIWHNMGAPTHRAMMPATRAPEPAPAPPPPAAGPAQFSLF